MIQKKVCILGPTGVGKTSLVKQFVESIFSEKYKTTIGVKIDKKQVNKEGRGVQLLLWDLEGIDRYCGFNPRYLRGASAYIIVVDQTRSQSLLEGIEILEMAKEHYPDIPAFLWSIKPIFRLAGIGAKKNSILTQRNLHRSLRPVRKLAKMLKTFSIQLHFGRSNVWIYIFSMP